MKFTWKHMLTLAGAAALSTQVTIAHAQNQQISVVVSSASWGQGTSTLTSLPQQLGFWEEEGLDVEVKKAKGSALGAQLVLGKDADVVHAGTSVGVISMVAKDLDMIAYYNQIIHNFQMPAVPADSPIKTLADLKGKKIGVIGLGTATIPIVKSVLSDEGLNPETDVTFVEVGYGAQAAAALWVTKQVDALAMYDSVYAAIENVDPVKYDLRVISSPLADKVSFQTALITRPDVLENKREELIKLARGNAKATIFALANPEAAVKLHWTQYPELKPTGVDEETALAQEKNALLARINNMRIDNMATPRDKWGYIDPIDVESYLSMLRKLGDAPEDLDASRLYTNELIDEINNFDHEAVRQFAIDYKVE